MVDTENKDKVDITTMPAKDLIEDSLEFPLQDESDIKAVSKELFSGKEIDLRTQVSADEINLVTKIRFLEEKFGIKNVKPLLASFLNLRVSLDRKSRTEFIQAITGEQEKKNKDSWWGKFFGQKPQ